MPIPMRSTILLLALFSSAWGEKFVRAGATGGNGTSAAPYGTIQLGVTNAADGETITVFPGSYSGAVSITGRNGLVIRTSNGASFTNNTSGSFTVQGSPGIVVRGITFAAVFGPAVMVTGAASSVSVQNCVFNSGVYFSGGAAVRSESGANVTIDDSVFINNANGAVYGINSNVTIRRCRFTDNREYSTGEGAVRTELSQLTVQDSIFMGNNGSISFVTNRNQSITVTNSRFYGDSFSQSGYSIHCPNTVTLTQSGNFFCGPNGNQISCQGWTSILAPSDPCNVCYGEGTNRDCAGVCFGTQTNCPNTTQYYYVSSLGNATNSGLSPLVPKNTIQSALNIAPSGSVVVVMRGRYSGAGNVNLNFGGKKIRLVSEFGKPEDVTVDCQQVGGTSAVVLNSGETIDTVIEGITFTNCTATAIRVISAAVTLKRCRVRQTGVGGVAPGVRVQDSYLIMEDSELRENIGQGPVTVNRATGVSGAIVRNSRFLNNTGSGGGGVYVATSCSALLQGNFFLGNSAGMFDGSAVVQDPLTRLILTGNSFTSNNAAVLKCGNDFSQSLNTFCGVGGNSVSTCGSYVPPLDSAVDICGICTGTNSTVDCNGVCWGPNVADGFGGCCREFEKDCFGRCFGLATYDCNGTCNGTKTLDSANVCCEFRDRDCLSLCFGGRENDTFGGCCLRTEKDCTSRCFGTKVNDCAGTCDGPLLYDNTTIQTPSHCCLRSNFDCEGECFGNHTFDGLVCCANEFLDCAVVCEGLHRYDNSTIRTPAHCCLPTEIDCGGICNGGHVLDNSTVKVCCHSTELDCNGFCYGSTVFDRNGICCNRTQIDCGRVCGGPMVNDSRGGCCLSSAKDCAGICSGNSTRDGNNTCCLDTQIDCAGVCFGSKVRGPNNTCCNFLDDCGVCNGNNACLSGTLPAGVTTGALIGSPSGEESSTRDITRWIILGIVLFVLFVLLCIVIIVLLLARKSKQRKESVEMQVPVKAVAVKTEPISVNRDASASSSSSGDETEDTTPQSSKSSSSSSED